jgi:hypothetical protein
MTPRCFKVHNQRSAHVVIIINKAPPFHKKKYFDLEAKAYSHKLLKLRNEYLKKLFYISAAFQRVYAPQSSNARRLCLAR